MKKSVYSIAIVATVSAILLIAPAVADEQKKIAVTIDDLPVISLFRDIQHQRRVTLKLLTTLNEFQIPAVGFVNEGKLYQNDELVSARVDLLRLWLLMGLELGNHTFSHPDLHHTNVEDFVANVDRGDEITGDLLAEHGESLRFFRHPFLHTGRSLEVRRTVHAFLREEGYRVAPVTIDNAEYLFARAYDVALQRNDSALAAEVGAEYLRYMEDIVVYYEGQSAALFDRQVAQTLLIHANTLNADWLGPLAEMLLERGYEFVTLDEALEDPAYESADEYVGPGGITWLHRWALTRKVDPEMFRGEPVAPDFIVELTR